MINVIIDYLESIGISPELIQPGNPKFGSDLAVPCFSFAKDQNKNPQEVAEDFANKINNPDIKNAEAVSGFLNIWFSDDLLFSLAEKVTDVEKHYQGKTVVCEYSDPNTFKVLHAGHLYTSIVGDAIANMFEFFGAKVHRVNFGGDVGMHAAKAIWAVERHIENDLTELDKIEEDDRADWIAKRYVEGNTAYEDNEADQKAIREVNKLIYKLHEDNDRESDFANIYWTCRQWSYDYFNAFYDQIGTPFEKYYPESVTAPIGLVKVKEQQEKGVYVESEGAIIFEGEKHGLHNRVFINSEGLPTYEAKDVGLIFSKWEDYHYDESVIITGSDIIEYMKVVMTSISQYAPELVESTEHLTHGMVKLAGGTKMSSRLGNFLKATDVIDAAKELSDNKDPETVLAAVKYGLIKHSIGQDIHYNPEESTSVTGNSGPYLQYAHARACSILAKTDIQPERPAEIQGDERILTKKIADFHRELNEAFDQLAPNKICTYLFELTQVFNRFYESNQVIGSDREPQRLSILVAYKKVLSTGLSIIGINAPEKM